LAAMQARVEALLQRQLLEQRVALVGSNVVRENANTPQIPS
jgi:hypothetical protein